MKYTDQEHTMVTVKHREGIANGRVADLVRLGYIQESDIPNIEPYVEPKPSVEQRIAEIERQQTPRRIREAALGDVNSIEFIRSLDNQIRTIRAEAGMEAGKIKKKGIISKVLG